MFSATQPAKINSLETKLIFLIAFYNFKIIFFSNRP